jgi:hypothetical protein
MSLLAAGSVGALAGPARQVAAATSPSASPRGVRRGPPLSKAMLAEIAKQQRYVADALKTIRSHPLPSGSDMAFEFRPLRPKRRK